MPTRRRSGNDCARRTGGGEVWQRDTIPNRADPLRKRAEKFGGTGRQLRFRHEAGPCVSAWRLRLHRRLTGLGHDCVVVALSLIPVMQARVSRKLLDRIEGLPQSVRYIA